MLPEDVLFHILLWLPVASLLRFKSVCKAWCALIETPAFIDQHTQFQYHRHLNNYNLLIGDCRVLPGMGHCRPLRFFSISGSGADNNYHQHPPVQLQLDSPCFQEFSGNAVAMVTCNGLICLLIRDISRVSNKLIVCLWNPATRKLRALPQSPVPPPPLNIYISIGFGFDGKTNDYKVVRIVTVLDHPNLTRAEVYSLNTDSWRTIDSILPVFGSIISNPKAPLYRNGLYCWSAVQWRNPPHLSPDFILSFDFSEEVFGTMSFPDAAHVRYNCRPRLAIIKDNIACITKKPPPESEMYDDPVVEIYEIWVLNNYGVKESWTKLFTYSLEAGVSHLSNNGTSLFFLKGSCFYMYNLVTQEIKDLPGPGFRQVDGMLPFAEYKDSLVSVDSGNGRAMIPTCVGTLAYN